METTHMNWNEALNHFGLDYEVAKRPVVALLGNGQSAPVDNLYSIVRTDTNEPLSGVAVNGRYTCIQTKAYADIGNKICGQLGAEFVRGGKLLHGRGLYLQAKLPDTIRVKGTDDAINKYLTFVTSHDGSMNFSVLATAMRLFCENQMNALMRAARNNGVKIRHTASADERILDVDTTILDTLNAYRVFEQKIDWLADQRFTDLQFDLAVQKFFDIEGAADVSTRAKNNIAKLKESYLVGPGQHMFRGTAWGAFNGFTNWIEHVRSTKGDTDSFESSLIGSGAGLRIKALDSIESAMLA